MLIQPKLEILPEPQLALWPQLKTVPEKYVLYGGTAIALRYGHRNSVDFDFFSTDRGDIDMLTKGLPFVVENPLSKEFLEYNSGQNRHVFTHTHIDYYLEPLRGAVPFDPLDPAKTIVKVTFANDANLIAGAINSPDTALGNGIKIASPLDLLAAKILAMDRRSEERDFIDVSELIKRGVDLQKGFEAAFAISKISPLGPNRIQYGNLKEDFKAKTLHSILPNAPERVEIIREAAAKVDIEKMQKTRLKASPSNFKQFGMGR